MQRMDELCNVGRENINLVGM